MPGGRGAQAGGREAQDVGVVHRPEAGDRGVRAEAEQDRAVAVEEEGVHIHADAHVRAVEEHTHTPVVRS
jgi:hypothetical protein